MRVVSATHGARRRLRARCRGRRGAAPTWSRAVEVLRRFVDRTARGTLLVEGAMSPRSSIPGAVAATLVALAAPSPAAAQDTWRRPHRAVRHIYRRVGALDWHLVSIDLTQPGVRVVGTPESMLAPREPGGSHTWRTTTEFAREVGAEVAINANYYDIFHGAFTTCGLTVTDGQAWRSTYIDRRLECWDSVGFGRGDRVSFFDSHGKVYGPAPERWMRTVVTGSPRVLANGEVLTYTAPRHALVPNPRTLLGASADRHTLYIMVVNGREGANKGMTCPEAARILRDFGASDAVNLDGGGSSTLYIRAEGGLVSRPGDRLERPVGNHLGIVLDAPPDEDSDDTLAAPTSLRASVSHPSLPQRAPQARAARTPTGPAAPRRTHAGCQATPGLVDPELVWAVLAAMVLYAVVRRSPNERT